MKWHCSHQEWDEEHGGCGFKPPPTSRSSQRVSHWSSGFSGHSKAGWRSSFIWPNITTGSSVFRDIQHLKWQGTRTRDGHVVTSELFNGTRAGMDRAVLKMLLVILFTMLITVTQAKNVRMYFHFELFLYFILVTWQKRDAGDLWVLSQQDKSCYLFNCTAVDTLFRAFLLHIFLPSVCICT